jgi:hypothetical protein
MFPTPMFPTPKERYERYLAWCRILDAPPLSFTGWLWQMAQIPEHLPVGWTPSSSFHGIRA